MADSLREKVDHALADLWDPPFAVLRQQLADRFAMELDAASAETARAVRHSSAESLNLGVRRILHATTVTDIGAALLEAASGYCGRVALLVHKGDLLSGWRTYGLTRNGGDAAAAEALARSWAGIQVQVSGAPAFAQAIESRETVVSLSLADHLSAEIVQLLDLTADEKVYLFPLSLRQIVVGVVYADGRGVADGVLSPAIEMLCAVAEAALEAISSRTPVTARGQASDAAEGRLELPVARPAPPPPPVDWSELTAEEHEQHLRAQRFARVLVADLQLYRAAEIREGKQARNIYGRLQDEIEKSREVYHRKFGPAFTDYFHVELLRTLADNEEELMGPDYPGPLVASVTAP